MSRYAVIIAVYNEDENVPSLHERLSAVFSKIDGTVDFWFIDDGSTDKTADVISALALKDPRVNLVSFSRNFGHHTALFAGISYAKQADFYILMDGDLQDKPEDIPLLIAKQREGFDLVYAIRQNRVEGAASRGASNLFWRAINFLSDRDIPHNQAVFRLFSDKVRDALVQIKERHLFLAGIFSWVGFDAGFVPIEHAPRYKGVSKYDLFRQLRQALNAVIGFSVLPLRYITYGGLLIASVSFLFGIYLVLGRIFSHHIGEGWTSLMVSIFLALGVQMICIGVIAEYIGKMFQQVQDRPNYIVKKVLFGKARE